MNELNQGRLRILFDASMLAEGLHKTSQRSGIFWTTYEIFRELDARDDVELGVYAPPSRVDCVNAFLVEAFPGRGYRVLNRARSCFLGPVENWILGKKELPCNKAGLRRRVLQVAGLFAKVARILWDKHVGSRKVAKIADGFDAFFSPVYLAPWAVRKYSKVPRFAILYDTIPAIFPQFSPVTRLGFSWNFDLIRGLREDDRGFAISECTKRDFLRFAPRLRAENVDIVPLAAGANFHPVKDEGEFRRVRDKYGIPEGRRYVLSLCTIAPHKNLGRALEAFGRLVEKDGVRDIVFVLAGGKWGFFEGKWAATLEKLGKTRDLVIPAGYIDDEDLAALYSGAEMFVYPSLYEGFGLPPLEAMQCGTPVITSNVSSIPEVVGDAAITVDPESVDALAEAMERLARDAELRAALRTRGLARAAEFSWAKTADLIVRSIRGENLL